jgi:hypothetical protein
MKRAISVIAYQVLLSPLTIKESPASGLTDSGSDFSVGYRPTVNGRSRCLQQPMDACPRGNPLAADSKPALEAESLRSQAGIPVLLPVVDDLRRISAETGIPFEQS